MFSRNMLLLLLLVMSKSTSDSSAPPGRALILNRGVSLGRWILLKPAGTGTGTGTGTRTETGKYES